eukprot:CAMPEP_0184302692 /NCGR_PEP_ID=MMETSP1049-20130417/12592_1 /TAXON_ID=77928 /ORGANISM="Proteomonas sulcata, Strain CCMP704" /LENGTH=262 /DNA_ID=CAMNT_0026614025 /DNA_START=59 /DNA_END=847 /DNA_ORIENTATION=+
MKEAFVDAIVYTEAKGEEPSLGKQEEAVSKAADAHDDDAEVIQPSAEFVKVAESGPGAIEQRESKPPADQSLEAGKAAEAGVSSGESPAPTGSSASSIRVEVLEVKCLPTLLEKKGELKELVLKLRCLGGKLESAVGRFDNSEVAGGFVKIDKEWGQIDTDRNSIKRTLEDTDSIPEEKCLDLQLWCPGTDTQDDTKLEEPQDQLLGIWRLPLSDFTINGDQNNFEAAIISLRSHHGWESGEQLITMKLGLQGKGFIEALNK